MKKQPIIGLNMSMDIVNKYEKCGMLMPVSYVDAIAGAGGVPVCLPPYHDIDMFKEVLPFLNGVLFIGGDDYLPEHYGGHPQPAGELMPERRDRFDLALAKWILKDTSLPVLAVCGGHQLISIALGGALIQDIRTEWQPSSGVQTLLHSRGERTGSQKGDFRHHVRRESGSLIARVTHVPPDEALQTNSFHHQAVHPAKVGRYLRATAWSDDGVIEAIEPSSDSDWGRTERFVLGVQWHPERMQDETPNRNIFLAFVEAARNT
jgi:putative glutamine amidotransferase